MPKPLHWQFANDCFAPIVLKKSFFAMTENSQDRWCVSLAAMRGTISNTAKPTADARIDFTDLAAASIAQMNHLRDFRSPAIFEFFNTIRHERSFISLVDRVGMRVEHPMRQIGIDFPRAALLGPSRRTL
jgi:hypothetical protein